MLKYEGYCVKITCVLFKCNGPSITLSFVVWIDLAEKVDAHFAKGLLAPMNEPTFTRNRKINFWNFISPSNLENQFPERFSVNSWTEIVNRMICIWNFNKPASLSTLLNEVPLNFQLNMWLIQDGVLLILVEKC